ncbi:hypothetical protein E2C01_041607 [Portunus trituberculatus]|uniref:Uncharacterized protein n=1 Tax=Portunus trituberculatus TaxID=210409 RepID=A0A5B7FSB9_PORTR|nr:hypothetical protein [Portunus trituberculatus]
MEIKQTTQMMKKVMKKRTADHVRRKPKLKHGSRNKRSVCCPCYTMSTLACHDADPYRVLQSVQNTDEGQERAPVPLPRHGQRAEIPNVSKQQDATTLHMSVHVPMRQMCKHCSCKGNIHQSCCVCDTCKVALCLTEQKNCFDAFHKNL